MLEKEASQAAEASATVQATLEAEIGEHDMLQATARTICEALAVEGAQSGSSLRSRLAVLSGQMRSDFGRHFLQASSVPWPSSLRTMQSTSRPSAMVTSCLMMTRRLMRRSPS